ncbi:hypothetical protein [Synechococcus sp. PCC 6312]|uniref:hypothetical protein n=1 Tax=Synechococcus sp. (strain ATCC 27167 / PCC 6312) TaxID=195253 RepID=UPI00029F0F0C|nr:hypothetical protein [Synechococcus sp. PCC 6312]AFY60076.1 hypothetical protein Syn6312_0868 [Synechococcus sp. PCC 6312]
MANPNPVMPPKFIEAMRKRYGDVPGELSRKVTGIKLPVDVDTKLRQLPDKDRVIWLRGVILDAFRRDFGNAPQAGLEISGKAELDDATSGPGDAALPVQKRRGRKPKGES